MGGTPQSDWDRSAYISIRRRRDALLQPISALLSSCRVHAVAVSLFGVAFAALACWAVIHSPRLALLAFLASLTCDALDGALARRNGTDCPAGKIVDHACDAATYLLILLAIARSGQSSTSQLAVSALLAIPLLLVAIYLRRRRGPADIELSGGFLAHAFKVPVYAAFLLFVAGATNYLPTAVRLANLTALLSLGLLAWSVWIVRRRAVLGAASAGADLRQPNR